MSLYVKILSVVMFLTSSVFANIISVNFYKDISGATYGKIGTNSFGVALEDSVTDGWIDKISDKHKGLALTTSDGTLSSVVMQTIRPNGNGYDATSATNYQGTAMRGFINSYITNSLAQITLDNLSANFPNGYKIITYLGGASQNSGASISLTEGEASEWDIASDETFYFKTRYQPDPKEIYSGPASNNAPTTIYVGAGFNAPPYYSFYEDAAGTSPLDISDLIFYKGKTYTFERLSGVGGHPFSISDTINNNSYYNGGLSFTNSIINGIQTGEKITFTIPTEYSNEIHYYCVAHPAMVSANGLELGSISGGWNGTPEKATDKSSDVGNYTLPADYAVFYNLTADKVTLTLDSMQGGTAGIGGFQIIGKSSSEQPNKLSINFIEDPSETNQYVTGTYGLPVYGSDVAGWHNTIDPTTNTNSYWDFSNGSASTVQVTAFRNPPNAIDEIDDGGPNDNDVNSATGSDSDNYDGTPFRAFMPAQRQFDNEVHLTLNNLNANFPNGAKIIAYLGGQSVNGGARVRLSKGGSANDSDNGWLAPNNDLGTYYYKTRWNPDGNSNFGQAESLVPATNTVSALLTSTVAGATPVAEYAIWENVTEDKVTITVDTFNDVVVLGQPNQPAGLSGFQIIGEAAAVTSETEYKNWQLTYSLDNGSENLDADNDGIVNVLEYALGTDPLVADVNDYTVSGGMNAGNLTLTHPIRSGLDHGLTYTVETTDDLKFGEWTSTGVSVSNIVTSGILDQITHSVSSTNDNVFLRLKVNVD